VVISVGKRRGLGIMKENLLIEYAGSQRITFTFAERAAMETLIDRIGAAERVAVDTEADSLHNYLKKVCLIQLSLGEEHYLVDPLQDWT